jgi:histidinol-phosphate aminotransferase
MDRNEVLRLLERFDGLVILDEAYNDFSPLPTMLEQLDKWPNLIVLQTFSKAWGCAAIRLGMAFASPDIIGILTKIKYPYNVNLLTQREALHILSLYERKKRWVKTLKEERTVLIDAFARLPLTQQVYPTDANFFLARVTDAPKIYAFLVDHGIIVRNRHNVTLCGNCLRITVGKRQENETLINTLKEYQS